MFSFVPAISVPAKVAGVCNAMAVDCRVPAEQVRSNLPTAPKLCRALHRIHPFNFQTVFSPLHVAAPALVLVAAQARLREYKIQVSVWLPQGNDPDSRAIAVRIRAFLHDNQVDF